MGSSMEPGAICKCSNKGRNLVICIDGTSNQFGDQNTNVVELYSKIVKTEDSGQLTYYNSGIGTYAKPSWKSVKYLMQVFDNSVDLAIAWNFEKIVMGAYRWLSDKYQENDRIFLFGFSRGAYQVRTLAGMIQRVGLIHMGNEEQIPFAYELYATHNTALAARFKSAFSRENVQVHFVGVWDTVSSVGIIRGKSLPLTDSADHVCFFRHALALDERRVKFLPEYIHGGICEKSPGPERLTQIQETGLNGSPHIKEVWFPGTHSDIGGGNQLNPDLDLGRTPFLWMSFEAVSCGLRLRPTRVEWRWDHLSDMKESLTGVWHIFEWMPFKRLSYKDESSTVYRPHKGRGRKIKSGQKLHSSIAFCDESYHPRAMLPGHGRLDGLVGKGSISNREWVTGWEDLIEMDIFDLSLMSNVIDMLKSRTGSETSIWVYRLTAMTSTDEGLTALRGRPNIINDLVQIFTCANQPVGVQECVIAILEQSSKDHASILLTSEHRLWLLRVAREKREMNHRSFAVKLLAHSLSKEQSCEGIIDENALGVLDEMARDEQQGGLTDGAFAMLMTILSQNTLSQKQFAAITLGIVRKRFTADDSSFQDVAILAKRLLGVILQTAENRQHLFDNDVLHSFLTKIDNLNRTELVLFSSLLVNQYEYLPSEFFTLLTSKLCNEMNVSQVRRSRYNILFVLRDTIHSDGLRERIWNSETAKALRQAFNQVGLPVRSLALELYRKCIIYENLRNDLFDTDTVRDLWNALFDRIEDNVRGITDFFIAAMAQEGFRDKIFDTEIIIALQHALSDQNRAVRSSVVEIFTSAITREDFRDKLFDTNIITTLGHALSDQDQYVSGNVVKFFTCAIAQESFRNMGQIVTALQHSLSDQNEYVRCSAVQVFTSAIAQKSFRDKIFDNKIISALEHALCDRTEYVRSSVVDFFTCAAAQEGFRDKIFDTRIITALGHTLSAQDGYARDRVVIFFTCAIAQESFRDMHEIVTILQHSLSDRDVTVRCSAVQIFTSALAQEGSHNEIFDIKTISALGHALSDRNEYVRSSVVSFFTCAIAQEVICNKIFDNKIITKLGHALSDQLAVRHSVVQFFTCALAQEGICNKIFYPQIITALGHALSDQNRSVRCSAVNILTSAIAQENTICKKIFDTKLITALGCALSDHDAYVRGSVVEFLTCAIAQEGFHDQIFDTEIITALGCALSDGFDYVGSRVVQFFTCAIAHSEGFRDKIVETKIITALHDALCCSNQYVRSNAIDIFISAIAHEGFRNKMIDTNIITALGYALSDESYHVRMKVVQFLTCAIAQEGFRDQIFDTEIIMALQHALRDRNESARISAVEILTCVIAQEGFRDKIFDTKIVTALHHALGDENESARISAVEIFTCAIAQEGFCDKIFNTEIITALQHTLSDPIHYVRISAVKIFTRAIAQEGIRNKIFDTNLITALGHAVGDQDAYVRSSVVEFLTCAIAQEGPRNKLFDAEIITALQHALSDQNEYLRSSTDGIFSWTVRKKTDIITALQLSLGDQDEYIRCSAVKVFTSAIIQESIRDKIFDIKIITALQHALSDQNEYLRSSAVEIFTSAIAQEGFCDKIFDNEIITALGRALSDESHHVTSSVLKFFTCAIAQESFKDMTEIVTALQHSLSDQNEHVRCRSVKIFTTALAQEGIRNKIFDSKIITALGRALSDQDKDVKSSVVEFFTSAIAHECFQDMIFDSATIPSLVKAEFGAEFWSHDSILCRAYNHFITSTLCEQLTSPDLTLRDQTRYLISEVIKYDDVHTRICTVELRKHFHCLRHELSA